MRIAVDVMGTDHGPEQIILGAVQAAKEYNCTVYLVGDRDIIESILLKNKIAVSDNIKIEHATEVIEMTDHPGIAVRKKKDSSIVVATRLVKNDVCDAVVSSGSTGAAAAAALLGLGRISGIERAAIATPIPNKFGTTVVLDSGANVDSKPQHLEQSALMGALYAERVLNMSKPRVGLLSIGEEPNKGNELTVGTHPLLVKNQYLNFIGNVEGRDITNGTVDVVVCDGFVGNIVLKLAEGLAKTIFDLLKEAIDSAGILGKLGAFLILPALKKMKTKLDAAEYGGAPLLGVNKEFIICHGSSGAKAIKNAVRVAIEFKQSGTITTIKERLPKTVVCEEQSENKNKKEMGDENE